MNRQTSILAVLAAVIAAVLAVVATTSAQQQAPTGLTGLQQPARDTPAQNTPPPPAGRIGGRVIAADNARPVKRARVFISAAELPGGRGVLTDDSGIFDFTELPAGRYTLTVSKSGFVNLSYGQRRPLQAGTPLQVADGQQIKGIEFRLPRGSAIAGHVYDEDGDPVPGIPVRVMRYQYAQGDRRLVAAGTGQTDDKGQYRVWGLMPGDYYVNAQPRGGGPFGGRGGPAGGRGQAPAARGGQPTATGGQTARGGTQAGATTRTPGAALIPQDDDEKAYAPTYFPGVTSISEARPIALGLSQESLDNDFGLRLVHVSTVAGHVTNPDGSATSNGNVTLLPDGALERGGAFGVNYGSRIQWDGTFAVGNVPPGRYILRVRSNDTDSPQFGSESLTVGDGDVTDLAVILAPGASLSGSIVFPTGTAQPPDPNSIRIAATSTEQQAGGQQPQARVQKDFTFTIDSIPTGPLLVRPNGNLRGFALKSVIADGRDVTDTPIELRAGQTLGGVIITLTNAITEIDGTVTDSQKNPVTEYTVLAFSTDPTHWRPQSRHISTARPDQTGQFKIRGLPAGNYYVTMVDPAQQGEWFDPAYLDEKRVGAGQIALNDGDTKTYDLQVRTEK